ncbi:MAG: hypothetical protein ACK4VI_02315 [Alphaproteobacteria bacterium]
MIGGTMKKHFCRLAVGYQFMALVVLLCLSSIDAQAQDNEPVLNVAQITQEAQPGTILGASPAQVRGSREDLLPANITSVLFMFWEYDAIQNVKKSRLSGGFQRGVTQEELERELAQSSRPQERGPPPPPEEREVVLGGIAYLSKNDWTIWLNGQRVTPDALPPEIIDLRVNKQFIDMKWLDEYTQRIFPIRLRAHQRFNLDSRIFLPG